MPKYIETLPRNATRETRALHFVNRAKQVHGDTYDYSLVLNTFVRQQSLVSIICKHHGVFEQLPTNHLSGKGCKKCAREQINAVRYASQYALAEQGFKTCSSCKKILVFSEFHPEPNGRKLGKVGAWCKKCYSNKNKTQYKERIKTYNLKKYGISLACYADLLEKQRYRCKICGIHAQYAPATGYAKDGVLCVDHDHETNKVRGLLCSNCNTGLGLFFDNINNLEKAILYLKENSVDQSGSA